MILIKRKGYPEEGSLVWCTVTKIHFHSVFCQLEEYDKQGMIHISEVSPGRIRNIRDYVKEGKPVVCKVLQINHQKGHIDLSLRRVTEGQKRKKASEIKQEQKAEKILESVGKRIKLTIEAIITEVSPILNSYDTYFSAFEDVVDDNQSLAKLGVNVDIAKALETVIKEKIKPKEVCITGKLAIKTYHPEGITIVKDLLKKLSVKGKIEIKYAGGGNYRLQVKSSEYKEAEKYIKEMSEIAENFKEGEAIFTRDK